MPETKTRGLVARPRWMPIFAVTFSLFLAEQPTMTRAGAAEAEAASLAPAGGAKAGTLWLYVGTYTGGKAGSKGIYLLEFELATGKLTSKGVAAELKDPSFLAVHPDGRLIYAVNEGGVAGQPGGGVSALAIEPQSGRLRLLNQQSSVGGGPCFIAIDPQGKNALVANYGSGSVACLPIRSDGTLAKASSFIQHKGSGSDPGRQEGPHAHSINLDKAGRFAFAADLGLDKVFIYKLDPAHGELTPNDPPFAEVAPRSGPRHFAFSPDGKHAYVIGEMGNTITVFDHDAARGALTNTQVISTLPAGFRGKSFTAEVQVHPSGKFVYGSNRGHDSIAIFAVEPATGKLAAVGHEPTQGKNPRNFAIDPTGTYLLAENQDTGTIVPFRIDPKTGKLTPTGESLAIPMPVCIKMIPKPATFARSLPTEP